MQSPFAPRLPTFEKWKLANKARLKDLEDRGLLGVCGKCLGSGEVLVEPLNIGIAEMVDCPDCDGTGASYREAYNAEIAATNAAIKKYNAMLG